MFINTLLARIQNSKIAPFICDSLIFKNIDLLGFILLLITLVFTAFAKSSLIGISALCFTFCMVFKLFFKKNEKVELVFINKILIIYLLFVFISLAGASYFVLSLKGIIKTVIYISFYFAAAYFFSKNKNKILPVIITIAGLICFEAVIAILQNICHIEAIATWQDMSRVANPADVISRAYGTLYPYNPNLLAGYLLSGLSCLFACCAISFCAKKHFIAVFFGAFFLITCYSILVTGSRGAYLGLFGFFITVLFIVFILFKKYAAFFSGFIAACFIGICLIPAFLKRILSIFSFRGDSSISFRINVYKACIDMFLDNLFLGIGVGNKNFREIYGLYMKTGYDALGAYSVPLEIAVESGIFALLAFGAYIILVIKQSLNYVLNNKNNYLERILVFSIVLTVVSVMFHGFFDTIFFRPQVQIIFWINLAVFNSITAGLCNKFCNNKL